MAVLQQYKCPCCDGAIEFDSTLQKMKCPYCNTEYEVETLRSYDAVLNDEPEENMQWNAEAGQEWDPEEAEGLRSYCCNSCGGEIVSDATTIATHCPYCDNPVILSPQLINVRKPDLVIPFKVDKKAAMAALQKHYSKKPLLPKVFKDENHVQEVKGLYVPVWLFDGDAYAHVRYKATRVRFWSDSHFRYTETRYYSVTRAGNLGFENVPVDGSTKMDDTLMESIEPYCISDAVDFQTAYLSGYLADKYDVDSQSSIQRANQRIHKSTEDAIASTVTDYTTVIPVNSSIRMEIGKAIYALYPVWILNTLWKGQRFTFAVNGQTGKLAGDLPMDTGAFWKWLIGVSGIASAAILGLSYLLWML